MVPGAQELPVTGGALWHDYKTDEGDRLTLAFALGAARFGAVLANYADAFEPIRNGNRIAGMRVRDAATGDILDVRVRVTVNAAGADAARVMAAFGARRVFPLVKAMNVVQTRQASGPAVALPTKDGRLLVALPWRGRLTIGTSHGLQTVRGGRHAREGGRGERVPRRDQFGVSVAGSRPRRRLARPSRRGPRRRARGEAPTLRERAELRDHAKDGIDGAVSVVGVKYTTARLMAERAIDARRRKAGRKNRPEPHGAAAPGGPVPQRGERASCARSRKRGRADHARVWRNGRRVLGLHAEHPDLGRPLAEGVPVTGAQVLEAVRHEMAMTLEDIVVRRTGLGAAGHPGDGSSASALRWCSRSWGGARSAWRMRCRRSAGSMRSGRR